MSAPPHNGPPHPPPPPPTTTGNYHHPHQQQQQQHQPTTTSNTASAALVALGAEQLFHLRPIVEHFVAVRSAYARSARNGHHLLCLADAGDQLFVHRTAAYGPGRPHCVRTVNWFRDEGKRVQDLCFDASGSMLLVLCYENTLHTLPVSWVLDGQPDGQHQHLAGDRITSFVVPFAGPHNCPNSKTCPNNTLLLPSVLSAAGGGSMAANLLIMDTTVSTTTEPPLSPPMAASEHSPDDAAESATARTVDGQADSDPDLMQQWSPLADAYDQLLTQPLRLEQPSPCDPCPYPTSVVWWQTLTEERKNRAIVGYSDGTICIVGLEPHCPLVAHTSIAGRGGRGGSSGGGGGGGVMEMIICRDSVLNNVTLMITAQSREQWKLMLEQKSIGYTYPGTEKSEHFYSASSSRQSSKESHDSPAGKRQHQPPHPDTIAPNRSAPSASDNPFDDWQIVVPLQNQSPDSGVEVSSSTAATDGFSDDTSCTASSAAPSTVAPGILPSARARLASLKELGAKKIGALKLKLAENRTTRPDEHTGTAAADPTGSRHGSTATASTFAILDAPPLLVPERLTTAGGPFFIVQQQLGGKCVLSALHEHSDTLSLHSIDVSPIPLCIYKVPVHCSHVLVTPHLMYTISGGSHASFIEAADADGDSADEPTMVSVIGTGVAELRIGEEADLHPASMIGRFRLAAGERIVAVYRLDEMPPPMAQHQLGGIGAEQPWRSEATQLAETINSSYVREMHYMRAEGAKGASKAQPQPAAPPEDERRFLRTDFPPLTVNGCVLVTNRGACVLEMRTTAREGFGGIAQRGGWSVCEEFCRTFRLNFGQCVEFAGDEMLRAGNARQALQCYNVARIPSVKTALKLAMFGENNALMHLCAMALKTLYVLKSTRPLSNHIGHLRALHDARFGCGSGTGSELTAAQRRAAESTGLVCTDFSYEKDEAVTDLQMSNSSQFHLSNLLLLTLTERTIKEHRCMPLWNFLVTNKKYHPNMTSIVLCQSGLYCAAVLLACARGAHLDAFCGLVGVSNQEFGWYNELNKILLNLAEPMFMECIIYMYTVSQDYFAVVQNRMEQIELDVLEKLRRQLDPFSAVFRPVVSQLDLNSGDADPEFIAFCKSFIETFLLLLINIHARRNPQPTADAEVAPKAADCDASDASTTPSPSPSFANALSSMCGGQHEDTPVALAVRNNSPLSAGFSHCACIVDGIVYAWGSNGVNCLLGAAAQPETPDVYSTPRPLQFLGQLNVVVHAVRCGRTHTLILTNNGLYSTGANQLGQLGIGVYTAQALQPMLVRAFDGCNVTLIEAGQYHNAAVVDGRLFTWGWGVYGQLGHGDVQIVYEPQPVAFFNDITIHQLALGHAHTLVLGTDRDRCEHVYVFGSNHYGQLGVGQPMEGSQTNGGEPHILKSLVPMVLSIAKPIRLIHTKFFTNFIITDDNELYVWGASPQALRLQYQARKRARATQKQENEAAAAAAAASALLTHISPPATPQHATTTAADADAATTTATDPALLASSCGNLAAAANAGDDCRPPRSKSLNDLQQTSNDQPTTTRSTASHPTATSTAPTATDTATGSVAASNVVSSDDETAADHLYPTLVDTGAVTGRIVQISSGLYHSALVTDERRLYTWGKNLEKQLGRDRSQFECLRPTHLETVADAVHVECGADFTVFLAGDLTVRAFGNSSFGQCGRDIAADRNGLVGKLVRLRISKRVVRIPDSTQCVEYPVCIALPRPQINLSAEPVRYLKRVPQFDRRMVRRSELFGGGGGGGGGGDAEESAPATPMAPTAVSTGAGADAELYPNEFIHYCLFLFHGVYDAQALLDRVHAVEFKVRILMLNYNVREAFQLCLRQSAGVGAAIRTFEYFTKDVSVVPIQREDLKFLIYELFAHCLAHRWPVAAVEAFLLDDMEHYLFALAYVLFFNNNNTDVERQVLAKFTDLFSDELNYNSVTAEWLERSEQIFGAVSTGFKAIVCQKLFEYEDNFA